MANRSRFLVYAAAGLTVGGIFYAGRLSNTPQAAPEASADGADHPRPMKSDPGGQDSIANAMRAARTKGGELAKSSQPPATPEQIATRIGEIIRSNDPLERNRAWLAFIDTLSPSQMEAAVAAFRALGLTDSRNGEYAMLLSAWAKNDPGGALKYAQANTHGGFATNTILSTWASYDPEAAIRWAQASHTGDGANPFMIGIIRGLASQDPARATQLLAAMPLSRERGDALDGLLPAILIQGPDATRKWTAELADPQLRDGVMSRVAEQLAQTDPKGTADWLLANPGEATKRRLDDVLGTWVQQDKTAAVSYYQALPAGEERSNALRGIVNAMAIQDPANAARFMDSHAADVNDHVLQQFVWHSFGESPELAASYISRIGNADQQNNMYRRTLETWLDRDATAAWNWVQKNQVPPQIQQFVQRKIQDLNQRKQ